MVGVIFNARCDRAHRRPVAAKIPEQEHPQDKTFVRTIALSISSIPVAAPAPGHDPRRQLMTAASRARENAERMVDAEDPVRAIALSIRSLPVAAPAPGHDPPPPVMTAASRARENAERMVDAEHATFHRSPFRVDQYPH